MAAASAGGGSAIPAVVEMLEPAIPAVVEIGPANNNNRNRNRNNTRRRRNNRGTRRRGYLTYTPNYGKVDIEAMYFEETVFNIEQFRHYQSYSSTLLTHGYELLTKLSTLIEQNKRQFKLFKNNPLSTNGNATEYLIVESWQNLPRYFIYYDGNTGILDNHGQFHNTNIVSPGDIHQHLLYLPGHPFSDHMRATRLKSVDEIILKIKEPIKLYFDNITYKEPLPDILIEQMKMKYHGSSKFSDWNPSRHIQTLLANH
jgi:hypothetical protein